MARSTAGDGKGRRPSGDGGKAPAKPGGGRPNPALTAHNRRIMGKHYTAKYGVRKGRG